MPFKSESQRRYLWAKHPEIAKRWTKKYGSTVAPPLKAVHARLGTNKSTKTKHSAAHPGFAAVQSRIAKQQGVSGKAAGAILAASSRSASKSARRKNPRLNRVKG